MWYSIIAIASRQGQCIAPNAYQRHLHVCTNANTCSSYTTVFISYRCYGGQSYTVKTEQARVKHKCKIFAVGKQMKKWKHNAERRVRGKRIRGSLVSLCAYFVLDINISFHLHQKLRRWTLFSPFYGQGLWDAETLKCTPRKRKSQHPCVFKTSSLSVLVQQSQPHNKSQEMNHCSQQRKVLQILHWEDLGDQDMQHQKLGSSCSSRLEIKGWSQQRAICQQSIDPRNQTPVMLQKSSNLRCKRNKAAGLDIALNVRSKREWRD